MGGAGVGAGGPALRMACNCSRVFLSSVGRVVCWVWFLSLITSVGLCGICFVDVLRHVEVRHLLAFFQDVHRIDETGLMEEHARPIEDEPAQRQIDDDRDVDGFAEASLGAFIVQRIQKMNDFMLFQFSKPAGANLYRRTRRRGTGRSFERGHWLSITDAWRERKLHLRRDFPRLQGAIMPFSHFCRVLRYWHFC